VEIAKAILSEIDSALIRRLVGYAVMLARAMPGVFDGVSPEDLVQEALVAFLMSDNGLNWNPTRGSLEKYLSGVVKNKFLAHARRSRRSVEILENGLRKAKIHVMSSSTEPILDMPIGERMRMAARGDSVIEELVEAAAKLESEKRVNQQLSSLLDTTIEDVVNRRTRLTRRFNRLFG